MLLSATALHMQEDNYEAVKNHMFDLLAEIASHFVPSQLDMLFAKLERRPNSSVQDTSRLLGLLQHLAASDNEVMPQTICASSSSSFQGCTSREGLREHMAQSFARLWPVAASSFAGSSGVVTTS
jgi:hypothetical protein